MKAAVRSVLPAEEAAYLERAYSIRSRTVHDAALHGRELLSGGWGLMSVYVSDSLAHFEGGTVQAAQAASKAMILNALGLGTGQSSRRL